MTGDRPKGGDARVPEPLTIAVGADRASPARARRAIKALGLPRQVEKDAMLLTSELVSNSVLHAGIGPGDAIMLKMEAWPDHVHIAVRDPGRGRDRPAVLEGEPAFGGWGMRLVQRLSDGWGVAARPACTCVWFDLSVGG